MEMLVAGLALGLVGWLVVVAVEMGLVDHCLSSSLLGLVTIVRSSCFGCLELELTVDSSSMSVLNILSFVTRKC